MFDLQGILGDPPVIKGLTYIDAEYIKFITDHLSDLSVNSSSVTTLPFVTFFPWRVMFLVLFFYTVFVFFSSTVFYPLIFG